MFGRLVVLISPDVGGVTGWEHPPQDGNESGDHLDHVDGDQGDYVDQVTVDQSGHGDHVDGCDQADHGHEDVIHVNQTTF